MDFITLKKRAAKILNLLDGNNNIQTGKDITETRIGDSINDAYLEDSYPRLQSQYPDFFSKQAVGANYTITGTVSNSSTGTTLVATSNIFDVSMIGQYVENQSTGISYQITDYTNQTTVIVGSSVTTWIGATIRIIDRFFTFNGDATDAYTLHNLFVRYKSTDTRVRVEPRLRNDIIQTGFETISQSSPIYYLTNVTEANVNKQAFCILPLMQNSDDKAMEITYLQKPGSMSADSDVPQLPIAHHEFLCWRAIGDGAVLRGDFGLAQYASQQYGQGLNNMINEFRMTSFDTNIKVRVPRIYGAMQNRRI